MSDKNQCDELRTYPVLFMSMNLGIICLMYAQVQIISNRTISILWKLKRADYKKERYKNAKIIMRDLGSPLLASFVVWAWADTPIQHGHHLDYFQIDACFIRCFY